MSVLFLPPSAGAASVPDATETVSGKIRIATSAEATAGTLDTAAMTPLKVKSVVDAAVVGGVTYQGTFDTSSPVDLSNAEKGDLYIISVAGTYQGITWAVGDHLLVNADMGGTISPSKIDKVDNTDAVTSVAGRTGAVTLSASDVSGLAAVATSGAYSDLSGTPTLGTAAAEDVGTSAGNVVQLDGSARLPAVDGSQLLNLPSASVAALDDIGDVSITSVSDGEALVYDSASSEWVNGSAANTVINQYNATGTAAAVSTQDLHIYRLYGSGGFSLAVSATEAGGLVMVNNISGSACTVTGPTFRRNGEGLSGGVTSITVEAGERRSFYLESTAIWLEVTATHLDRLADVSLSSLSAGETLIYNGTLSAFQNSTLATVATTGAYSDLSGTPTLGTAAAEDVGTAASNVVQLDGSARLPAVDGSQLLNLPSGATTLGALTDVDVTGVVNTNVIKYNSTSGDWEDGAVAYSEVTGTPTLGTAAAEDVGTAASNVVQLDGSARLPAVDGSQLTNLPSGGTLPTVTTQTASYTIPSRTAGQLNLVVLVNNGASAVTIDLPSIASGDVGFMIDIKVLGTGSVTVDAGSNYIDDGATTSISITTQYDSRTFVAGTTTDWYII